MEIRRSMILWSPRWGLGIRLTVKAICRRDLLARRDTMTMTKTMMMKIRATQRSYRLQGIKSTIISELSDETQLWISTLGRYTTVTILNKRRLKAIWSVFTHVARICATLLKQKKRLHKKRDQLPQDWFRTPIWPPFHCFGTPLWPP